jgi:hypothetical protein
MLKNLTSNMKRDTSKAKFTAISPASLLGVFVVYCQRVLVDESEMIRTQMGTHNKSEIVADAW